MLASSTVTLTQPFTNGPHSGHIKINMVMRQTGSNGRQGGDQWLKPKAIPRPIMAMGHLYVFMIEVGE